MAANYSVLLTRDGEGLHAYVTGQRSLASTLASWQDILEHVRAWTPRWLFVCDELQGEPLADGERAEVAALVARGVQGVRICRADADAMSEHCEIYACEPTGAVAGGAATAC